jgi:hypothetical protein
VAIVENSTFAVGDFVYLRGDSYCYRVEIISLQENGIDVTSKTVLSPIELGLKFNSEPRKAAEIYYLNTPIVSTAGASAVVTPVETTREMQ